jgi:hypothetical protein
MVYNAIGLPRRNLIREDRMSTVSAPSAVRDRLVLDEVDWWTFTHFLRLFAERPGLPHENSVTRLFRT